MATEIPFAVLERVLGSHDDDIWSVAVTPQGDFCVTASFDSTLGVWDLASSHGKRSLEGHGAYVTGVAVTPNGEQCISTADDGEVKLWDLRSWAEVRTFTKHWSPAQAVCVTPNGAECIVAFGDSVRRWHVPSGQPMSTLERRIPASAVAITNDGKLCVCGTTDGRLVAWNLSDASHAFDLPVHSSAVTGLLTRCRGNRCVSASTDGTLKVWNLQSRACIGTMEGHDGPIYGVAGSDDGRVVASGSADDTVRIWDVETGTCLQILPGLGPFYCVAFAPRCSSLLACCGKKVLAYRLNPSAIPWSPLGLRGQARYTNAKIVLVGDSGVGKSGLGHRLAEDRWVVTDSTHGMQVWPLKLPKGGPEGIEREAWLWDLAGQPDYRLIHQLFLEQTDLALVLFNPQAERPFAGLGDWEKALRTAGGADPARILVAARTDVGGAMVTGAKIDRLRENRRYAAYVTTSAKTGAGRGELIDAIVAHIPWADLPWISTTRVLKALKDALVKLKEQGVGLIRFAELAARLRAGEVPVAFAEDELRTAIRLLAGQGLIKPLAFGDFVLLHPEQINNYASAVIRAARVNAAGVGSIPEADVLNGQLDLKGMDRLGRADEDILLRAMVQTFLDQSLCIREDTPAGVQLVFPSQFNVEMPEIPGHPNICVLYRFSGQLPTVYTTLVVRLVYSQLFEKWELWKDAAEFRTPEDKRIGFAMRRIEEGRGEIKVFFETGAGDDTRVTFIKFIHEHLLRRAADVERQREYSCPKCSEPVEDREAVRRRLEARMDFVRCQYCDETIPLMDLIERKFGQDRFERKVRELDARAGINLDNESKELILIGHAYAIAGEAGQIYRGYTNSDHGIDGEIEFKHARGRASGKLVYIQLKSGDSYLYQRKRDGAEVFTVMDERHLEYWQARACPVYLVIRTSGGEISWMNVTEYLAKREDKGSKQIIFSGEPFDADAVRRLREKLLGGSS